MTSSALSITDCGIVSPNALAVFGLTAISRQALRRCALL